MTSRGVWAALTAAGALLSLASGCGEVESCEEGLTGCLNGPADDSGNCRFGLVNNGTLCVVDESGGYEQPAGCSCKQGELCRNDKTCVNVCEAPTNLPPAKLLPKTCRPVAGEVAYDLAKASVALCYQQCIHRAEYCGGTCNPDTECTVASSTALAATAGALTAEQAMAACEVARDLPCAQQRCPNNAAPSCNGVACSNTCRSAMFLNDGVCDDGDLSNASSAVCDFGTDCGDCGPRRGAAPMFSVSLGDPCVDPLQCGGDVQNIKAATGWCIQPTSTLFSRCIPDCSLRGESCPDGFMCDFLFLVDPDGPGPQQQMKVTDATGTEAKACFPILCGD